MRGLTAQERAALLAPPTEVCDPWVLDELESRGLLVVTRYLDDGEEMVASSAGALALRLDAAARAMGGAS